MSTIYFNLLIACLTVGLAYLHKRLSERPAPTRKLVREEEPSDKSNIKMSA